jgi:hypothetical protein
LIDQNGQGAAKQITEMGQMRMPNAIEGGAPVIGIIFLSLAVFKFVNGDPWFVWAILGSLFGGFGVLNLKRPWGTDTQSRDMSDCAFLRGGTFAIGKADGRLTPNSGHALFDLDRGYERFPDCTDRRAVLLFDPARPSAHNHAGK